jgi:hypothetical protein
MLKLTGTSPEDVEFQRRFDKTGSNAKLAAACLAAYDFGLDEPSRPLGI